MRVEEVIVYINVVKLKYAAAESTCVAHHGYFSSTNKLGYPHIFGTPSDFA